MEVTYCAIVVAFLLKPGAFVMVHVNFTIVQKTCTCNMRIMITFVCEFHTLWILCLNGSISFCSQIHVCLCTN